MIYNLQDIINRFNEGKHLEYVFFWGHHAKPGQVTKACFSQWYPCSFEVDGITYNINDIGNEDGVFSNLNGLLLFFSVFKKYAPYF